jgi:hypothetical protein
MKLYTQQLREWNNVAASFWKVSNKDKKFEMLNETVLFWIVLNILLPDNIDRAFFPFVLFRSELVRVKPVFKMT